MTTTSFHSSNYGHFASMLPTDSQGYVHLTVAGWVKAGHSRDEARELANRAKVATTEADKSLAAWQGK